MRASGSSELRPRLGPTANIMGEAAVASIIRRQPWQVPLAIMSRLRSAEPWWSVMRIPGAKTGSVLPLDRLGVRGRGGGNGTGGNGGGSYVLSRGLTVTPVSTV